MTCESEDGVHHLFLDHLDDLQDEIVVVLQEMHQGFSGGLEQLHLGLEGLSDQSAWVALVSSEVILGPLWVAEANLIVLELVLNFL